MGTWQPAGAAVLAAGLAVAGCGNEDSADEAAEEPRSDVPIGTRGEPPGGGAARGSSPLRPLALPEPGLSDAR